MAIRSRPPGLTDKDESHRGHLAAPPPQINPHQSSPIRLYVRPSQMDGHGRALCPAGYTLRFSRLWAVAEKMGGGQKVSKSCVEREHVRTHAV